MKTDVQRAAQSSARNSSAPPVPLTLWSVASWFALSLMRHGRIAKAWRSGLRFASWAPLRATAAPFVSVLASGVGAPAALEAEHAGKAAQIYHAETVARWRRDLTLRTNSGI